MPSFLASTSSSNTFLGQYSSLLEEADGSHLSRTITSISADPSNYEECAADENDVTNGLQGGEKSLDNEFESRSAIDNSQGLESSD